MIHRVLSVTALTVRAAARSRMIHSLAVLLFLVLLVIPLTVKADGTLTGEIQLVLHLTLSLVGIILGIATLWAACAGISREIEDRRIRLVAVKPVRKGEIWFGKWLGLAILNAIFLVAVGFATWAYLSLKVPREKPGAEAGSGLHTRVLVGQQRVLPQPEDLGDAVQVRLDQVLARLSGEGDTVTDYDRGRILAFIQRQVLSERAVLNGGDTKTWTFQVPRTSRDAKGASVRVNVSPVSGIAVPEKGYWRIQADGASHEIDGVGLARTQGRIEVPFVLSDTDVQVIYTHPPGEQSILFDWERPIELLIPEKGFPENLSRALLLLFCRLAVLSALGLAAGTLFSFPVATFFSMAVLLLSFTGHYFIVSEKTDDRSPIVAVQHEESWLYEVGEALIVRLEAIAGPALRSNPFADLSDGILITGGALGEAAGLMLLYVAILGVISSLLLNRRELAA